MILKKDKSTSEARRFWNHVEKTAREAVAGDWQKGAVSRPYSTEQTKIYQSGKVKAGHYYYQTCCGMFDIVKDDNGRWDLIWIDVLDDAIIAILFSGCTKKTCEAVLSDRLLVQVLIAKSQEKGDDECRLN